MRIKEAEERELRDEKRKIKRKRKRKRGWVARKRGGRRSGLKQLFLIQGRFTTWKIHAGRPTLSTSTEMSLPSFTLFTISKLGYALAAVNIYAAAPTNIHYASFHSLTSPTRRKLPSSYSTFLSFVQTRSFYIEYTFFFPFFFPSSN